MVSGRLSEAEFKSSAIWLDNRGFAWQRMHTGQWRATDGASSGAASSQALPPEKFGPYTVMCRL